MGNGASKVSICSYDGAWCTECIGAMSVTVFQLLIKLSEFFVRQNNIWQTIQWISGYVISQRGVSMYFVALTCQLYLPVNYWFIEYGITSMKPFKDYTRLHRLIIPWMYTIVPQNICKIVISLRWIQQEYIGQMWIEHWLFSSEGFLP